ncbi:hypothetical protein M3175_02315 [Robertmurraya korlensis]|uniref:hypothetical protein n=1 Tax=Robertmurraya korlensis TaxID=519977 RepID=UPI002040970E|nr:hypothetical protein [Robertmurraya korlensis]MCM3599548.1 hypothetical protein [Robertmurraya korlensis]
MSKNSLLLTIEVNYFYVQQEKGQDMSDNRKEIIVKEIYYWKETKLLPEQYCNFLLALYTEGEQVNGKKAGKRSIKSKFFLAYTSLLLIPIGIFIYFTELSFFLQTTLYALLLLFGFGASFYFFRKATEFIVPMISTALIALLCSVDFVTYAFPNSAVSLYAIIILNCIAWFIIGRKAKLLSFIISSILGLLLLSGSIFI